MISIRPANASDIALLCPQIREEDKTEILAATGNDVKTELEKAYRRQGPKWAAFNQNGDILALFGIAETTGLSRIGSPWLIGSKTIMQHKRAFLKTSKRFFPEMVKGHHFLINMVDSRNTLSIAWLRWLGFTIHRPTPYGPFDMPFHKFEWNDIPEIPHQ